MTLSNVKLILAREVRDQLRDRRTLFMIAVLPIVLYPLLGISLLQVSQFMQEQPTRVLVIGADNLAVSPPLFENQQFSEWLFVDPSKAKLINLTFAKNWKRGPAHGRRQCAGGRAERRTSPGGFGRLRGGAVLSPGLCRPGRRLPQGHDRRSEAQDRQEPSPRRRVAAAADGRLPSFASAPTHRAPKSEIICNMANDKSRLASSRLSELLRRWTQRIGEDNLKLSGVSVQATHPFSVGMSDVADARRRDGAVWSKILPMLLLLWALTGAFYPAIDLCAGEKERGTLETLLSSPAGAAKSSSASC